MDSNMDSGMNSNEHVSKFCDVVYNLRSELDELSKNPSARQGSYQKILPNLCQLRSLNRITKEIGEVKNRKIGELNRKLLNLREQYDIITFEGMCMADEVLSAKRKLSPTKSRIEGQCDVKCETNGNDMSFFDIDKVGQLDHETRLQLLESEEIKRKALRDKLNEVTAEMDQIELVGQASEAQINRVKPSIKQLLDKVDLGESIKNDKKD